VGILELLRLSVMVMVVVGLVGVAAAAAPVGDGGCCFVFGVAKRRTLPLVYRPSR
jgi:hypothetical protein